MAEKITKADFARRKGVTRSTIGQAVERGSIETDAKGRIDWEIESKKWDDARDTERPITKDEAKKLKKYQSSEGGALSQILQLRLDAGDLTIAEANQIRGIIAASRDQMELMKDRGELVEREAVTSDLETAFSIVRSKVLALPTKLSIPLESVNERGKIEKIIKAAVMECLEDLALIATKKKMKK